MATQIFFVCLVTGTLLVAAEVFVPGGVLGVVGGLALIGAMASAFVAFPGYGGYVAFGVILLAASFIALWIRFFPGSPIGRKMTVSIDLGKSKGTQDGLEQLTGREGKALSDLRPGGFARIDGKRVDVVTQGGMIESGEQIRVTSVESNRVVVARSESTEPANAGRERGPHHG